MAVGWVLMLYHEKNILIACGNKKDRLVFFNYYDEQGVNQIFTASSMDQCWEILSVESDVHVLIVEISPLWLKGKVQIENIYKSHQGIKLIGVFSESVKVDVNAYQMLDSWLDDTYFSPVSSNELAARMELNVTRLSQSQVAQSKVVQYDTLINNVMPNSSRPQFLFDLNSQSISYVNDALKKWVPHLDLLGENYVLLAAESSAIKYSDVQQKIIDHDATIVQFELTQPSKTKQKSYVQLSLHTVYLDGNPYLVGELERIDAPNFYSQFINKLKKFQQIDFDGDSFKREMRDLVVWSGVDFLFAVNNSGQGVYDQLIWDFSEDSRSALFIDAKHDFILRALQKNNRLEFKKDAYKAIPGDEFLTFYSVNQLMLYRCWIEKGADILLVAGGQNILLDWEPATLLFSALADHLVKYKAFKSLRALHEAESQYDVLTGLVNRRYIINMIEKDLMDIEQQDQFKALVFLDLDRFKVINDSLGHDVGDDVLVSVSRVLKEQVGSYGIVARYAGDEFLVWFHKGESPTVVTHIANQIIKAVANPISLKNGSELKITVSLGITYYPDHAKTAGQLIKNADTALYDAKLKGKNCYSEYSFAQEGESPKQHEEMEKNLSNAIDNNELDVFFQPKIDAKTEDIMGFEALVRWEHPELGLISPGLFIPLAEQTGLIHKIGYFVMWKSCQMLYKWQSKFGLPLSMSINLSPIQLGEQKLINRINQVVKETQVDPQCIDFEITESEKFADVSEALKMMKRIVGIGCTLSIDDFGTGHSTLEYIRKIPAKTLKIDQTFVKNIGLSRDDEAILDATIDIAKRVGRKIVAEGVETEEQRHYLAAKGCEYFQGFLFCRPIPADEVTRILSDRANLLSKAI